MAQKCTQALQKKKKKEEVDEKGEDDPLPYYKTGANHNIPVNWLTLVSKLMCC
jgi:hypothetical protein